MDSSMCGLESILRPDIEKSSSAVQVILDRVPHRIFVANTSGIHLSVKTAAKYHEQRLSLVLLTWLQTVQPRQVTNESACFILVMLHTFQLIGTHCYG